VLRGRLASGWFSAYASGLDVMPILYLGGLVSMLAFPGFLLGVTRPVLSSVAAAASAIVTVAAGAVLAAEGAGLGAFAWLFTAGQAVRTVIVIVCVEYVVRRPAATSRIPS
jgi:hypothetical protein